MTRFGESLRATTAHARRSTRNALRDWSRGLVYGFSTRPWGPMQFPPGHFHSTLPSQVDIRNYRDHLVSARPSAEVPGIELRPDDQLGLLTTLAPHLVDHPFERSGHDSRYRFDNAWFEASDALVLHAMLRHFRPQRIVEVGSGFSTAAVLDSYGSEPLPTITLVEPYPERLRHTVPAADLRQVTLLEARLQDVSLEEFARLGSGDLLFVDSTHVSKLGSDVNYLLFSILPCLARGVHVHIHDLFFPFEYPMDWVERGWGWNEAYLVRAFLEYNDAFRVTLWLDMLQQLVPAAVNSVCPQLTTRGQSLWLRRTEAS